MNFELTDKEIREKIAYWQERLSLQDWRIELQIVDVLPNFDNGSNTYNSNKRVAFIWITRKAEDPEWTIIHELVHMHLWYQDKDEPYLTLEEQTVNALTEALLERKQNIKSEGRE